MRTLCWIDVPDDWRCEIMTSDGVIRPWTPNRPIAPTCRFRAWSPDVPRDRDAPWLLPGDYSGLTTTEFREAVAAAVVQNETILSFPGHVLLTVVRKKGKPKAGS